jgi:hypothetical protein
MPLASCRPTTTGDVARRKKGLRDQIPLPIIADLDCRSAIVSLHQRMLGNWKPDEID